MEMIPSRLSLARSNWVTMQMMLSSKCENIYKRLCTRRDLAGMPGFEEFRKKGFHSATDPVEVSVQFLELLSGSLIFKAYMVVTDRPNLPGETELQRIEYMYVKLLSDLLIRYRNDESELICCIEQNQGMGRL